METEQEKFYREQNEKTAQEKESQTFLRNLFCCWIPIIFVVGTLAIAFLGMALSR